MCLTRRLGRHVERGLGEEHDGSDPEIWCGMRDQGYDYDMRDLAALASLMDFSISGFDTLAFIPFHVCYHSRSLIPFTTSRN